MPFDLEQYLSTGIDGLKSPLFVRLRESEMLKAQLVIHDSIGKVMSGIIEVI